MTFLVFNLEANNVLLWVNFGSFNCPKYPTDGIQWSIGQKQHLINYIYYVFWIICGFVVLEPGVEFLSVVNNFT
jgi:hypothetical protein